MMPNDYIPILWEKWMNGILRADEVVEQLKVYGFELDYLTKNGIKASRFEEVFEFRYE
jgi:hypothetical protein